jgi:uncharacterized protein YbjT (DUF2867 family)
MSDPGAGVPAGDVRISMFDTHHIAAVAARVLTEGGHERAIYELTGSQALSFPGVAYALARASGRPIRYIDIPPSTSCTALRSGMLRQRRRSGHATSRGMDVVSPA